MTTAVVVIVLDLSEPGSVLPSALKWLELIKQKLAHVYALFDKKGLQLPEQLRQRSRTKLFATDEDKDLVTHTGMKAPNHLCSCCQISSSWQIGIVVHVAANVQSSQ